MHRIDVIGIGEAGMSSLGETAARTLDQADAVIGGARHLAMLPDIRAEKVTWRRPLLTTLPVIEKFAHPVVVTTGDPLWFGVGRRLIQHYGADRIRIHPQLSGFQFAGARLGWSLPDAATVTCHGRPIAWLSHHIAPGRRIIALTDDAGSPHRIRAWLDQQSYAIDGFWVMEQLGGPQERISEYREDATYDSLNMVALKCAPGTEFLSPTGGLADRHFEHDGKMTKSEVRAITLAKLKPYPHAVLWDVGAGSGSISLEWLRLARYGQAHAVETVASRLAMIKANAQKMGGAGLHIHQCRAPDCFDRLPEPDAIFIGGGLSDHNMIESAVERLRPAGQVVANAVTLDGEARLLKAFGEFGGELTKIAVNRAEPVGRFHGWRPLMPVTQWAMTKPT